MDCSICGQSIQSKYYQDSFGSKVHTHHEIEYCPVCGRIICNLSYKKRYSDGRFICNCCYENERPVIDKSKLDAAYCKAIRLLREKGFCFPNDIKVSLVSKEIFVKRGYKTASGLCVSQINMFGFRHHIMILFGLPELNTVGIIAHELLHCWQNQERVKLVDTYCEGICELGSGLVYKRAKSNFGDLLFRQLETNQISEYSQGFIKMKEILEKHGWEGIKQFAKNQSFHNKS